MVLHIHKLEMTDKLNMADIGAINQMTAKSLWKIRYQLKLSQTKFWMLIQTVNWYLST